MRNTSIDDSLKKFKDYLDTIASLRDWAFANIPEMECRHDEDCDHCVGMEILEGFPEYKKKPGANQYNDLICGCGKAKASDDVLCRPCWDKGPQ